MPYRRPPLPPILVGLSVLSMVSLNANAIITRHDVPDADYIVADDDWPAVVDLIQRGDCLATLITDTFLLTVAHCAQDMNNDWVLTINGVDHDVAEIILHPDYQGGRYDIALVRLEAAVQGVTPFPLYRGTDELGQRLILVGRGLHATGLEGEQGASMDQQLRRAENTISNVNEHWLEVRFEDPTEADVLPLEGVGAGGDSGGPAFIETESGLFIAGLNSWGDAFPYADIGKYGAWDYSTRVSTYLDWIDGIAGTSGTGPTTGTGTGGTTPPSDPYGFPTDTEGGDVTVVGEGNCGCQTPTGTAWLAALLTLPWIRRRRRGQLSG